MEFDFKQTSWLARFYRWSYGKKACREVYCAGRSSWEPNMPQSICLYSWALLLAFLATPITWVTYLVQRAARMKNHEFDMGGRLIGGVVIYVVTLLVYKGSIWGWNNPSKIGWGLLAVVAGVILFGLFFWIRGLVIDGAQALPETEVYKVAKGTVYSIKNKVCPKINWIEEETT